jgi:hypothetical protein
MKNRSRIQSTDPAIFRPVLIPASTVASPDSALEELVAPDVPIVLNLLLDVEGPTGQSIKGLGKELGGRR